MIVRELVVVPGHGICRPACTTPALAPLAASWIGIHQDEAGLYVEHAERAVRYTAAQPEALLVFSGGQTRPAAGPRSEAEAYYEIARDHLWWGHPEVAPRAALEDFARDSFENLLFSLHLFRLRSGAWPLRVTLFGWRFKQRRFEVHAAALGWQGEAFRYCGVNDPAGAALEAARASEAATLLLVEKDPLATGAEFLRKREERNPFHRHPPYPADLPPTARC